MLCVLRNNGIITHCRNYVGKHNNTCQWRPYDSHDTIKIGQVYFMRVKAENKLASVMSSITTVHTDMIGMCVLLLFDMKTLLIINLFLHAPA